MEPKHSGLKYRFLTLSIIAIIVSAVLGSLAIHLIIQSRHQYSFYYVLAVASFFVAAGIAGVFLVAKFMVQPVIDLTRKVYEVQQGNLDVEMEVRKSGKRRDELDRLFEGFNHMVRHLKHNINELSESKEKAERYSRELQESKKRLEAIFNGLSDGIMIVNKDFRIETVNPIMEEIMGRSLDEIRGQHCYEMCNGTPNRCSFCQADITFKTGQHVISYCTKPVQPSGEERVFEIHDFPLYNDRGEIEQIFEYAKDVTDAIKMQTKLESSRRLAAIGEMAAKVAHEVRNPLNAIKGAAHYLRRANLDSDSDTYLNLIEEQVERVNKVSTDLLQFSKPLETVLKPGRIQDVVQRALLITEPQLQEKKIVLHTEVPKQLPKIPLNEGQMERALTNLIENAVDAMERGGQLTLKVSLNGVPEQPEKLTLLVRDDGCGVDCNNPEELFKPFYTTKTKGTGLGLTIVKKIVDNHHGSIEIVNRPEKGTDVRITLPLKFKQNETQTHDPRR